MEWAECIGGLRQLQQHMYGCCGRSVVCWWAYATPALCTPGAGQTHAGISSQQASTLSGATLLNPSRPHSPSHVDLTSFCAPRPALPAAANSRRLSSTAGPLAGAAEGEHFTDAAAGLLASFSPPATDGRSLRAGKVPGGVVCACTVRVGGGPPGGWGGGGELGAFMLLFCLKHRVVCGGLPLPRHKHPARGPHCSLRAVFCWRPSRPGLV